MITEPLEEKALAALADVLSTLSGVRPGGWTYPRTPGVERTLPPPTGQQMPSDLLPRLFVVPARLGRLMGQGIARQSRTYEHHLEVDIHGLVEATDDALGDTWRWRLRQDVLETLHLHVSLMGTARGIDFSSRTENVDNGEIAPKLWFLQPITIWLLTDYATAA